MAPLNYRGRAGAIEGQKVKTFFWPLKVKIWEKIIKIYFENQCFSVQLVIKVITFAISWTIQFKFQQHPMLSARPGMDTFSTENDACFVLSIIYNLTAGRIFPQMPFTSWHEPEPNMKPSDERVGTYPAAHPTCFLVHGQPQRAR